MRPTTHIQGLSIVTSVVATQTFGCSFILDFDALQSGLGSVDAGAPFPQADAAPIPPMGQPDAGAACPNPCDDHNPCTVDRCVAGKCRFDEMQCEGPDNCKTYQCVGGKCEDAPIVGVVPDGYDHVVSAPALLRSELVVAGDRFYQATFGTFADLRDVSLTTFDATATEPIEVIFLSDVVKSGLDGSPVVMGSPVSLVAEERSGRTLSGSILNAYVAVSTENKKAGDLLRLAFDRDLSPQLPGLESKPENPIIATPSNFLFASERMGPSGGTLVTGEPFVVWAGDGPSPSGVYLQQGDTVADTAKPAFRGTTAISGVSAIRVGGVPGALWMTNLPGGVQIEAAVVTEPPTAPSEIFQCHRETGFVGYHLDVSQSIGEIWTVTWTKRRDAEYVTEISSMLCSETGCTDLLADAQSCSAEQVENRVFPNMRNLLTQTMHKEGDPMTKVYRALLSATEDPSKDSGTLSLRLDALEIDPADDSGPKRTGVGSVVLDNTTRADNENWPTLALLPPDKIAVSWIKRQANGQGDELHVQRHRICFPE